MHCRAILFGPDKRPIQMVEGVELSSPESGSFCSDFPFSRAALFIYRSWEWIGREPMGQTLHERRVFVMNGGFWTMNGGFSS